MSERGKGEGNWMEHDFRLWKRVFGSIEVVSGPKIIEK
jgi:hypothetical protein